jgi:hypothetical protein
MRLTEQQHAGVPLRRVRAGEVRWERFLYTLKAPPPASLQQCAKSFEPVREHTYDQKHPALRLRPRRRFGDQPWAHVLIPRHTRGSLPRRSGARQLLPGALTR